MREKERECRESVERADGEALGAHATSIGYEALGAHATSIGYTAAALATDSLHVLRRLLLLRLFY